MQNPILQACMVINSRFLLRLSALWVFLLTQGSREAGEYVDSKMVRRQPKLLPGTTCVHASDIIIPAFHHVYQQDAAAAAAQRMYQREA